MSDTPTPEMIEAGRSVFADAADEYSGMNVVDLVAAIYRAMRALEPTTRMTPQRAAVPICPKCGAATYSVLHVTECSKEVLIQTTHGSPELDEDAKKLASLGADPGPTFAELAPQTADWCPVGCNGQDRPCAYPQDCKRASQTIFDQLVFLNDSLCELLAKVELVQQAASRLLVRAAVS